MIVHCVFHAAKGGRQDGDWVEWVKNEHAREMLIAGAQEVQLVMLEKGYELRYIYETDAQYQYSRQHHADRFHKGDRPDEVQKGPAVKKPAGPVVMSRGVKSL